MSTPPSGISSPVPSLAGKYLTVVLGREGYGIAALKVREIVRLQKITPLPQMPPQVKGVINLRGRVIPVVDLRVQFGLPGAFDERTCIVVVQVVLAAEPAVQMGLVVDAVDEVVTLGEDVIGPPPDFGLRLEADYILGMARTKDRVTVLLDLDRVVAPETMAHLTTV